MEASTTGGGGGWRRFRGLYETGDRRKIFCDGRLRVPLVDLCEWYYHPTKGLRPTKHGIALRIQHVERDNSTVIHQVPRSTDDDTVFLRGGSPEPGIGTCLLGVQSLSNHICKLHSATFQSRWYSSVVEIKHHVPISVNLDNVFKLCVGHNCNCMR